MKHLVFNIQIKASKEKVWKTLWDNTTYRTWTSIFSEGSHAVTDWEEGSRILFLNGKNEGMYSIIEKNNPCIFMSFRHLGEIRDGKELPPDTEHFQQSTENYTLTESDGDTRLTVELYTEEEYQDYFNRQFPIALKEVKKLAEQ